MKRSLFILIFIITNITFVLLLIHKQSQMIQLSYYKQKIELEKNILHRQKQELTFHIYQLNDRAHIKKIATTQLLLEPIKISQIKKIAHESNI